MSFRNRMIVLTFALATLAAFAAAEVQLTALQLPEGKGVDVTFTKTDRAPAKSMMQANLKYEKGQATIELKFEKMEPAVLFAGDISAYVLWAVTSDGTVENLGEVQIDEKEFWPRGNTPPARRSLR